MEERNAKGMYRETFDHFRIAMNSMGTLAW